MARPLSACVLPVMMGALVSMLEGSPALYFLYAGLPIAIVLSAVWTYIRIQDEIVEIHIRPPAVSVRSLLEAARPSQKLVWYRLLDVRDGETDIQLTVGHDIYRLKKSDWEAPQDLVRQLQELNDTDRSHI